MRTEPDGKAVGDTQSRTGRWCTVPGVVVQGYGVASGMSDESPYPEGSVAMQLPFFRERGLNLRGYHPGTLNISIAPKRFSLHTPRYRFPAVRWTGLVPPENFSFSPCRVGFERKAYAGMIYYPHPSTKPDHPGDPSIVEVISVLIPGIRYGSPITLGVDPAEVQIV